jgi:pyruvate,water dikinase
LGVVDRFRRWLNGDADERRDVEMLRAEFAAQFERFKQLIAANRNALEKMAEIEEALRGEPLLGINFARSRCASVAVNVSEMVHLLNEMRPGRYEELFLRLEAIDREISSFVVSEPRASEAELVLPLDELDRTFASQVGDKMANLGELRTRLGLKTPDGFVATENAYWHLMEHSQIQEQIDELLSKVEQGQVDRIYQLSGQIQQLIKGAPIPEDLEDALEEQAERLTAFHGPEVPLAIRSSAQGEDLPGRSCAGMYRTLLGATPDEILDAYREVVASKYEARAMIYRLNYGIRDDHVAMCVGCMPLVEAYCGGVAYSRNPLDTDDQRLMVHSVFGLPGTVADGSARSDLVVISRDEPMAIVQVDTAAKRKQLAYRQGQGVVDIGLTPDRVSALSVDAEVALRLAGKLLRIEEHFGVAQDVEWALDPNGALVFLQCRPLMQRQSSLASDSQPPPAVQVNTPVLLEGTTTASPGVAAGPAHLVRKEMDAVHFPEGSVLVASQPLPDWALAMRRASAVICEQGSVAGHLANVARELGVPALFGVAKAMDRLTEGTQITVDADHKKIYNGRIGQLVKQPRHESDKAESSAVYHALAGAAEHIVHLGLLDPDDKTKFTPRNCQTLHDITRFCHERALREIFRFGTEHSFPERAAKQLHVSGPTQFWIIDLADGFSPNAKGQRNVKLSEIVSIPMLALWRGMMAIHWESPPVNAQGFLEVLMGSTTDPGLNPSMPSPYSERNYFMITRDYCSCKTRFGYHFSTVEALVGERRRENYISFSFRGGAAGERRRIRRARLVADILEDYSFRVHTTSDSVHARLEKYRHDFLVPRLEVIGYLMFHTRQLDMVLTDDEEIERYRAKFRSDLEQLLADHPRSSKLP